MTQLLGRKYGIYKEDSDEEELRGRPCRRNWEQEGEVDEKEERSYSADFADFAEEQSCKLSTSSFGKERQQDNHAEQAASHEDTGKKYIKQEDTKTNGTTLEDTKQEDNNENGSRDPRGDVCPHCRQELCRTCEPWYMRIIVDMKELSKTFAAEIRFCTLCKHGLCPGSGLVVFLQCRDCGHSVCEVCETKEDGLGEEWRVCCQCEKIAEGRTKDCLGPELNAPMYQEGADEDLDVVNKNEGRMRVESDGIKSIKVDDILCLSGGVDLGFPEWLVGGGELEASAARVHPIQQQRITRLGEQTK